MNKVFIYLFIIILFQELSCFKKFKRLLNIVTILFLLLANNYLVTAQTTYTSTQNGNWVNGSAWVGGTPIEAGDNAIIESGHTVTLTTGGSGTTINNLTINSVGVLNASNKEMNVNGNLIVNWTYTSFEGAAKDLNFDGDTFGGISINKNSGYFIISSDLNNILSSTFLHIFGYIQIDNSVTVTNNCFIEYNM